MALNQFPRRAFSGAATIDTFTGNGSTTAFTLNQSQTQNECFVYVDDVAQLPNTDYGINGTTLTFTAAPANGSEIIVRGFGVPTPLNSVSDGAITAAKLAAGAIEAKLGYTPVSPTQLSTEVANLVDAAPSTLNTLNELAAALGDDPNYATTITTALGTKANSSSLATVATSGSYNDLSNKPTLGKLLKVTPYDSSTMISMSIVNNVEIYSFTVTKVSSTSRLYFTGAIPISGSENHGIYWFAAFNGTKKYAGVVDGLRSHGATSSSVPGGIIINTFSQTGIAAGSVTVSVGWSTLNSTETSANRPVMYINPNNTIDARNNCGTALAVWEVEA